MFTKEKLIDIGADKLADIILTVYKKNPDVQKQFDIIVAGYDSDSQEIVSIIKEEIAYLEDISDSFLDHDYYEPDFLDDKLNDKSDSLADQIDQIRVHIMENLLPKWPSEAVELLLSLLDSYKNTFHEVDSEGNALGVFQQVCADLGKAYERVTNPMEDIVKLLYDRFMNNSHAVYNKIIFYFKDVLGDEGLKQLKQKFEQSFNEKNAVISQIGLKNIADCENNVDAYIKACSLGTLHDHDRLEIARKLIQHKRAKEAIEWLDKIETQNCWQTDRKSLKIEALELCGNHQEAQEERKKWFDSSLSSKIHHEILKHSEPRFIESWKTTAIQKAFEFRDPHVALDFLREIKEYKQAAKFVYTKIDVLNGRRPYYYTLRPIADILCNIDPLAATLLYRELIEPILEDGSSKYYYWAAKDLAVCHILSSKITDWQGYESHQLYFEELSYDFGRKRSFWPQYTLALKKKVAEVASASSNLQVIK